MDRSPRFWLSISPVLAGLVDDIEFLNACSLKGVTVRALTGGIIEVESVGGFMSAGIMSVVNQAYSRLNSAKVKDGLARRRAAGHYVWATARSATGITTARSSQTQSSGTGPSAVARTDGHGNELPRVCPLKPWGVRLGLKSWVRNPMLRGIVPHQKDGVRPLVSADEWEQAKRLLSRRARSRVSTGVQRTHLFSSLIVCASCGRSLHRCVTGYLGPMEMLLCPV